METFVALPEELKILLLTVVTVIVTEALKALSGALKFDLSGYAAQVTSAVVAGILVLVSAAFSHIPPEVAPIANSVLSLIVVLLGSWGTYKLAKQFSK